jgi:dTDP-glucose pyrophosphorylase
MIDYKKSIILESSRIIDALSAINFSSIRMALVCDKDMRLSGVITDGDIRRYLIKSGSINDPIDKIINKNPTCSTIDDSREERKKLMIKKDLIGLPIIDKQRKLLAIESNNSLFYFEDSKASVLIQAGGFGKRLLPLTSDRPKPMIEIGGKPILETIISNFKNQGFKHLFISTHYMSDIIIDYFGDGSDFGVEITYINETTPLGTGGVIGSIEANNLKKNLLITNGDILTNIDFNKIILSHEFSDCDATVCSKDFKIYMPYGVFNNDEKDFNIIEKPTYSYPINTGIYVLKNTAVLKQPKNVHQNLTDIVMNLSKEGPINIFGIDDLWIDIGIKEDLDKAKSLFYEYF